MNQNMDTQNRLIDYMRISVTDLCNMRCKYCMPYDIEKMAMDEILTFEEIETIVEAAVACHITKFKITGGEPLVRRGIEDLLQKIGHTEGVEDLTLTTNGVLLKEKLPALLEAGVSAVNVSIDTLDAKLYRDITGTDYLNQVLEGLYAACEAGLLVKVNSVLQEEVDATKRKELVLLAKENPIHVRFIEAMPLGYGDSVRSVSGERVHSELQWLYPGMKQTSVKGNGPAVYYEIPGFAGTVGFISPMHRKFCASCNRLRLTSVGGLKPCLCYGQTFDLRAILRHSSEINIADTDGNEGVDQDGRISAQEYEVRRRLENAIFEAIAKKPKQHQFEFKEKVTERKKMVQIGG